MDFLISSIKILFCRLQTITSLMKYSAGSSSNEWREQELVQRSEQGAGDQDIVPFTQSQSKARTNTATGPASWGHAHPGESCHSPL